MYIEGSSLSVSESPMDKAAHTNDPVVSIRDSPVSCAVHFTDLSFPFANPIDFCLKHLARGRSIKRMEIPKNLLASAIDELAAHVFGERTQWAALSVNHLKSEFSIIYASPRNGAEFFRIASLTDCADAYAAISSIRPKSARKLTKINLSFVRDSLSVVVLSFVDAGTNAADTHTKLRDSLRIFPHFRITGRFRISFFGREGSQTLRRMRES